MNSWKVVTSGIFFTCYMPNILRKLANFQQGSLGDRVMELKALAFPGLDQGEVVGIDYYMSTIYFFNEISESVAFSRQRACVRVRACLSIGHTFMSVWADVVRKLQLPSQCNVNLYSYTLKEADCFLFYCKTTSSQSLEIKGPSTNSCVPDLLFKRDWNLPDNFYMETRDAEHKNLLIVKDKRVRSNLTSSPRGDSAIEYRIQEQN